MHNKKQEENNIIDRINNGYTEKNMDKKDTDKDEGDADSDDDGGEQRVGRRKRKT